jgi:hypothetical protein
MGLIFKVGDHEDMEPVPVGFPRCGNYAYKEPTIRNKPKKRPVKKNPANEDTMIDDATGQKLPVADVAQNVAKDDAEKENTAQAPTSKEDEDKEEVAKEDVEKEENPKSTRRTITYHSSENEIDYVEEKVRTSIANWLPLILSELRAASGSSNLRLPEAAISACLGLVFARGLIALAF